MRQQVTPAPGTTLSDAGLSDLVDRNGVFHLAERDME